MRLFALSISIVIGFGIGAWAIAGLIPEGVAPWAGITLSMVWLFLLIFGVLLTSSRERRKIQDQRRLLAYSLLAAVLTASFLMPLFIYHIRVPKRAAEGVVAAIAGAVFLLSKHLEHRKLQRTGR